MLARAWPLWHCHLNIVQNGFGGLSTSPPPARASGAKPAPRAAARRQALRANLIDAAETTIAEGGLADLNARDLARQVGCAVGAIYNVFPHLDAVIFEVNARTLVLIEKFIGRRLKTAQAAPPGEVLGDLAIAYLDFAAANRPRWRAMFEHSPETHGTMPQAYRTDQARIFGVVELPLSALRPDLPQDEIVQLSRTIFSAVHGIVTLGLDEKLGSLPVTTLRRQVREFVGLLSSATPTAGAKAARGAGSSR